jgi:signal transduction histidine kinase
MRLFPAAHPVAWDIAVAVLVATGCVSASAGLDPAGALALMVVCSTLFFRRRAPLGALMVATVAVVAGGVAAVLTGQSPPWCYLAVWILLFHVGLRRPAAAASSAVLAGLVVVVAAGGAAPLDTLAWDDRFVTALPVAAMSVAAFLGGLQVRSSRETNRRRQEEAAREAVAAERSRIAREIHDLIGHDLSVIASLSAGGQTVARSSPGDAERAFAAIGEVSRASVGQLRHVLRLLRSADDEPGEALAPQPDVSQLDELLDAVRAAGLPVEDERQGDLRGLPAAHQLAVYRIVQEALTNTLRHRGGGVGASVTVRIVVGAGDVVVTVTDRATAGARVAADAAPIAGGHGIIGMRERVGALGGELQTGPTATGWLVRATIPREVGETGEGPARR